MRNCTRHCLRPSIRCKLDSRTTTLDIPVQVRYFEDFGDERGFCIFGPSGIHAPLSVYLLLCMRSTLKGRGLPPPTLRGRSSTRRNEHLLQERHPVSALSTFSVLDEPLSAVKPGFSLPSETCAAVSLSPDLVPVSPAANSSPPNSTYKFSDLLHRNFRNPGCLAWLLTSAVQTAAQ